MLKLVENNYICSCSDAWLLTQRASSLCQFSVNFVLELNLLFFAECGQGLQKFNSTKLFALFKRK